MSRRPMFCAFVVLVASLVGCGDGSVSAPTGKAKGVVTYQGNPLANVNVTFTPKGGRPGYGATNERGEFTISTFGQGDGAVPGEHTVTISDSREIPMPGTPEAEQMGELPPLFPPKYSDPSKSGLTANVKEGEINEFKFELND